MRAAVAQGAQIWLLDEPTTFLDYHHQEEILALIARGWSNFEIAEELNNSLLEMRRYEKNFFLYQNEYDYLFDSTKFEKTFNFTPTSYQDGFAETVRYMKN